jgi:exodeoxyribonuclease X
MSKTWYTTPMKQIIFFDTETTGIGSDDRLCQLAYKTGDTVFCQLYKPDRMIPYEASAVHHVSNQMVADKPAFIDAPEYTTIQQLADSDSAVWVAHNAKFDIAMLAREGIHPKNVICTLRVARALDTGRKFTQYKLQYLRYALDFDIQAVAHDALGDVLVMEKLFDRLLASIEKETGDRDSALQRMMEISATPTIYTDFTFGKHIGKKITEVLQIDRGYLEWLLRTKLESDNDEEDWIYTLRYYLGIDQ